LCVVAVGELVERVEGGLGARFEAGVSGADVLARAARVLAPAQSRRQHSLGASTVSAQ
jgi:hypothetical protein